jgi:uncharacterized protein (DUF1501 family)
VLAGGLRLVGLTALAGAGRVRIGFGAPGARDAKLVLLQLTGGNDGLSMVVPYADDAYHRARKHTRIDAKDVLRLDERVGLHPALGGLRARFDGGDLAIVQGVGYPDPSRSHFRSLDVWHTADPLGSRAHDGWIGKVGQELWGADYDPDRVVHIGSSVPYSLHSRVCPPVSFVSPETYRFLRVGDALADVVGQSEAEPASSPALEHVRRVFRDAARSSDALRGAVGAYRPRVQYPADALGASLRTAAALLDGPVPCRVVALELGGFDTHVGQRRDHDQLMRRLDAGLGAFLDDLEGTEAEKGLVVLAFSEFGRRVVENGSGGTDHGTAGPVLLAGGGVRGGLYGPHPSLADLDDGDLVFGTDFRSLYGEIVERCFELPQERVLGERFPVLDALA